jgi:hypothetical protein
LSTDFAPGHPIAGPAAVMDGLPHFAQCRTRLPPPDRLFEPLENEAVVMLSLGVVLEDADRNVVRVFCEPEPWLLLEIVPALGVGGTTLGAETEWIFAVNCLTGSLAMR